MTRTFSAHLAIDLDKNDVLTGNMHKSLFKKKKKKVDPS